MANSYDEVPYDSTARYPTHPDCLAILATLTGVGPAPPDRCRYLEIGCSTGGNLLPMAEALPDSNFVGIDLSARQIDFAQRASSHLGLKNLRFEACSLGDFNAPPGSFDYVVAHGVYSWVTADVRDALLAQCKRLLAPNGVAYVSYNTYPGWHLRAPVRDLLNFNARGVKDLPARIVQGRAFLDFVRQHAPAPNSAWGKVLDEEAELIRKSPDYYIAHEHFEGENTAFYFLDFMAHARRHGLQYLGEAGKHYSAETLAPDVRRALEQASGDLLELEQALDFMKGAAFRRTLLVHADRPLTRSAPFEVLRSLRMAGLARPTAERPDVASRAVEEFRNEDGLSIETSNPVVKAALMVLFHQWPRDLAYDEVVQQANDLLGTTAPPPAEAAVQLAQAVAPLYLAGLLGLHVHVPAFMTAVSDRPTATPLARLQANSGAAVINRRHREVPLSGLERMLLAQLDGRRDRSAILEAATARTLAGDIEMRTGEKVITDPPTVRAVLNQELDAALQRLAQAALLVA